MPIHGKLTEFALLSTHGHDKPLALLIATRHYNSNAILLRGVVIGVRGSTPVYGPSLPDAEPAVAAEQQTTPPPEANLHLIVNERTGTGISGYFIKTPVTQAQIDERFAKAKAENRLPMLPANAPQHRITVSKLNDPRLSRFAIFVTANDAPRAVQLMEQIADARPPPTVAEIAASPAYRGLLESSQKYRDYLAKQMATALGVEIDEQAAVSHLSHAISPVAVATGARPDEQQFRVYHDAYNTDTAHAGVLVAGGALGDYTHITSSQTRERPNGELSRGWSNAAMSSIVTSTGSFAADVHKIAGAPIDAAKTHFKTDTPGVPHPIVAQKTVGADDPQTKLAIQRAKGQHALETAAEYTGVAAVVPNVSTLHYPSTEELVRVAKQTTAKAVPVPHDHPIVGHLAASWHLIKPGLPANYTWADAFGSDFQVPVDPILVHNSAHPDTQFEVAKQQAAADTAAAAGAGAGAATTTATGVHFGTVARFGGPFAGVPFSRRWYRYPRGLGFGTALALDTALLLGLGASRYRYPYPYGYPYPYYYY